MSVLQKITIDIWSDIICPFCYLGKKKLEFAIDKFNAHSKVEVRWHSFQLDPEFPKNQSMSSGEYLSIRKGISETQLLAIQNQMIENSKKYKIDFRLDRSLIFNTFNAHQLLKWSTRFNKQTELKSNLFKAHFSEGEDLSNTEVLLEIVHKSGLNSEEAKGILSSSTFKSDVEQDIIQAQKIGIRGVPFFIFNGTKAISGAQDDTVFEELLAAEIDSFELKKVDENSNNEGDFCSVDDGCN
jgi:predicted DsbA family dithiol-disulfide isomerase